jgi:hypothetical protein
MQAFSSESGSRSAYKMKFIRRILGVTLALVGVLSLVPAAILFNQKFNWLPLHIGIFDPAVGGEPVSTVGFGTMSAIVGFVLLGLGVLLLRYPRRSVTR